MYHCIVQICVLEQWNYRENEVPPEEVKEPRVVANIGDIGIAGEQQSESIHDIGDN